MLELEAHNLLDNEFIKLKSDLNLSSIIKYYFLTKIIKTIKTYYI